MTTKLIPAQQTASLSATYLARDKQLYQTVKRILDFVIALTLLVILSPLFLVIALCIKLDSPGPVIFSQKRVGRSVGNNGDEPTLFTFYKFRSMRQDAGSEVHRQYVQAFINGNQRFVAECQQNQTVYKLEKDQRVTRFGRFIRKTSLDELPQLINVLKGDMSLVGPRPALPYEVEQYKPWHYRRLEIMPGITGLWQVEARSTVPFNEMVNLDIQYAEHQSLWLDLKILFQTIPTVLSGRGAG
ncbi:MAG: sugar transferase [Chloroflexi bacterium]|nr:sugar transferase [Chloroflexota bacterium]